MDRQLPTRLAALAQAQHGVVSRTQLLRLGLSAAAIDSRVRRGALYVLHRGVYAVGHTALRDEGRWLAALLACGRGAALSHHSAARLWEMRSAGREARVHVTTSRDLRPLGVVVHRARVDAADVTRRRGLAVTSPARTLVDLAAVVPFEQLRMIADRGVRLDAGALRRAQARMADRRGARAIDRLLGGEVRTRSALERRLLRICREAGLPRPSVNERVVGRERDFAWAGRRVVVEVDGHAFHAARPAREDDHERDAQLVLAGWRVVRFTYAQVFDSPDSVAATLAALL